METDLPWWGQLLYLAICLPVGLVMIELLFIRTVQSRIWSRHGLCCKCGKRPRQADDRACDVCRKMIDDTPSW